MIAAPDPRGRAMAAFFAALSPRLLQDLEDSGLVAALDRDRVRDEWEALALYACVRGLVAAGGFNRETAQALDALHDAVAAAWRAGGLDDEQVRERRARIARRYEEYGDIGRRLEHAGRERVPQVIGEAAAAHMASPDAAAGELAETVGALHEELATGAAEAARSAE